MLPNFFVAGAQKCATTSLHMHLAGHPQIYLPRIKETKHFALDERYEKGMTYYETTFFGDWNSEKAVGEVDPDYIYFETVPERMAAHLDMSALKFIFIFRNPVDRAFSHYLMTYRRGLEPLTFSQAVDAERERIAKDQAARLHYSYVDRGFYAAQLERFLTYVSPDRMLLLLTEDLKADPQAVMKTCFSFIGVDTRHTPGQMTVRHHQAYLPKSLRFFKAVTGKEDNFFKKIGRYCIPSPAVRQWIRDTMVKLNQTDKPYLTLDSATRRRLQQIYAPHNDKLGKWMKRDLSHWNT